MLLRSGHAGVTLSTLQDILPGRNGPRRHFGRMPTVVGQARAAEEGSCSAPLGCPRVLSMGTVSLLSPAPSRQAWRLMLNQQTSRPVSEPRPSRPARAEGHPLQGAAASSPRCPCSCTAATVSRPRGAHKEPQMCRNNTVSRHEQTTPETSGPPQASPEAPAPLFLSSGGVTVRTALPRTWTPH